MSILTHDEAKRLSQSSTDPLEVIRNVEAAVIVKLAGMQNALKDEIRLIWQPKCDALRQQLEAAQAEIEGLATVVNLQVENYAELKEQYGALEGYFYTVTTERDAALARLAELPDTCDGKEQEAFEAYAVGEKLNMQCHPLHYLFLNGEPYAARQSWKAAILYCRKQVDASAGASPVEPSQAQPPAPGEAAREYMTGYSDAKEWAGATNQAQQAQSVPEPVLQWCDKCGEGTVQGLCRGKLDDCKFKQAQPEPYGYHSPKTGKVYASTEAASMAMAGEVKTVYLATQAQPSQAGELSADDVRAAGGIVHSDGSIFFTNIGKLNAAINAKESK